MLNLCILIFASEANADCAKPKATSESGNPMLNAEFLRRQADNCLRIARSCFDLSSAERLRLMAQDLQAKADEIDRDRRFRPNFFDPSEVSSRDNDRG
jgi:hypothetical protein